MKRVLLIAMLVVAPVVSRAQDDAPAPSGTARLSAWIAQKASERPPRLAKGFLTPDLSDAEVTALIRGIEENLTELRTGFPPESLDLDGVILFRSYESLATSQLGDLRWRRQPLPRPGSALATPSEGARLPRDYYAHLITSYTNTPLTADELRSIAERELARRHDDIRGVMKTIGRTEPLERFFEFLRTDERFYYPDTDAGREAYLAESRRVLAEIQARLETILPDPPNVRLDVARNRSASESQSLPQYAPSVSLPDRRYLGGTYLIPLADMRASPKYLLAPIAYHEGVPGHHLQFSIQEGRTFGKSLAPFGADAGTFPAYAEGWGFYAEQLPYELGPASDPYSDVGRLGADAWRSARVLVDIGFNIDGWSEQQGLDFLLANAPIPEAIARIEMQRVRNIPGQTAAYLIGKLAFERQRARAQATLGSRFELRAFHDLLLRRGPMPLSAFDEVIDRWIASIQK